MTQLTLMETPTPGAPHTRIDLRSRVMWWAPHGVLPMIRELNGLPCEIQCQADLLIVEDWLTCQGHPLGDPELTRQALVELAYGGKQLSRRRWMSVHRADCIAYASASGLTHAKTAPLAQLAVSTVGVVIRRRTKPGWPGDGHYQYHHYWDGSVWGATPLTEDEAAPMPLRTR